ncbi:MAG: hypothetical protein J0H74_07855 [Chitinophagaceae bacterium]|nr:hypothetical protein [Chitinophagaceae bacterium]
MKRIFLYLQTALMLTHMIEARAQGFKAGAAMRIITPAPLLPVSGGIGKPNPSHIKKGELTVRALVMEQGSTRIAVVGVDNLGWTAFLGDKSRALIKGILPENILIGATHTHSAPDAYAFPDETGRTTADLRYLDWCTHQIADAVNEAVKNLEPAVLKTAVGEAKGKIAYNYYAEQLYDPRCGVIQAVAAGGAKKGRTIATLVNYAIHPEVIGSHRGILSPDLCGPLYERIESKTGGIALFMNGAQGGMVTADNRLGNGGEANDYEECVRIGQLLADEALRIVGDAVVQTNPALYCSARTIRLPVENPVMRYILSKSPLSGPSMTEQDSVSTRINLLDIGTAQVLTVPGEALPNIGYYVKRHMRTSQPFLFGLTNDAYGYILTKVDFKSFKRYEYVSNTSLGEMTGEIYMEEALRLVGESPPADR